MPQSTSDTLDVRPSPDGQRLSWLVGAIVNPSRRKPRRNVLVNVVKKARKDLYSFRLFGDDKPFLKALFSKYQYSAEELQSELDKVSSLCTDDELGLFCLIIKEFSSKEELSFSDRTSQSIRYQAQ